MGQEGRFIEAAIKAGVKRFISSKFGGNTQNGKTVSIFRKVSTKAKMVVILRKAAAVKFVTMILMGWKWWSVFDP